LGWRPPYLVRVWAGVHWHLQHLALAPARENTPILGGTGPGWGLHPVAPRPQGRGKVCP